MQRRSPAFRCALFAILAMAGRTARADDGEGRAFSVSGFGTLGIVHSSEPRADFVGSPFQASGAGYTHRWDAGVDSKIGLQLTVPWQSAVTAVVQVVAQHQYDDSYKPEIEWANIKYQITPDLSVRAGRLALPVFMLSDSRLVGYSNPWIRPPVELYSSVPVTSNDGADLTWRLHADELTSTVQLFAGRRTLRVPGDIGVDARKIWGANVNFDYGALTLKALYQSLRFDLKSADIDGLFEAYNEIGAALASVPSLQPLASDVAALVARYRPLNAKVSTLVLAASYDPGTWLVMGEYMSQHGSTLQDDQRAGYLTVGYRFGILTPFISVAAVSADSRTEPGLPSAQLPAELAPVADALNAGLQSTLQGFAPVQRTVSLGLRWDVHKNFDVKAQYDRTSLGAGSTGDFANTQPDFPPGSRVNLVSLAVDFVF